MGIDPNRAKSIFLSAVEGRAPEQWSTYLDEACQGDAELRQRVEALLTAHPGTDKLLDNPDAALIAPVGPPEPMEAVGTVIGRYKLLERIGEGGMAVVYMAEQEQPIRRKVALKIIKLGMDTRQVIARFEAERQALAMMDHPNIAKVLDAGATETGRPYFVMELVTGVSITEYCDKNSLSTKDRLPLFIQVCHAVQHAHQKGIIHRDIKPSNVMITQRDGIPVPKVIDFGIAKATNQQLTEKTLFTHYAHIIGTPAYMSPEQAELSDVDIDTRSDIYSLGVLLYELLTGTTPFSEEELRKAGYIEMQRVIREEEPAKPSTRLSTLSETVTDIAKHRGCTPDLLRKAVRGDLDWIVMRSLEKDRSRRYGTANALGIDVQRHLDSEPVLARAPSPTYRLRKFLRRHRSQIAVAATLAVLVGAAIVGLSTGYRDRRELARAESQVHAGILSDAHGFFARAEYQKALECVKGILDSPHVGPDTRLLYASILIEGRQSEGAVTTLEALCDERPEIAAGAYLLLARVLWESESSDEEKLKKVEEYRRTADELFPETAGAYYIQALMAPTIKERLDLLDEALSYVDPRHYESCRLRAFTYYASRRYEEMAGDARVMTVLRPEDSLGYSLQAIAMRELGYYEDAIEYLDAAIGRTTGEGPECTQLYDQQCETYLRMGEPEQAYNYLLEYLKLSPDSAILQFRLFCAMIARGNYEEADALQRRVTASDHEARVRFRDWSMKYVFDTLGAGLPWHPAGSKPEGLPFLPMLDAEEMYVQLSTKARRLITGGFAASWPPDGKKMIFSLGIPGSSGIATFDPTSQEIDLLIAPGKDPAWSPDGRYIAFVRDCQVLPVSELVTAELSSGYRSYRGEEIWIMNADGTAPRRLARGRWPSWGRDSKYVYYQRVGYGPHRIAIEDRNANSEPVLRYWCDHCSVSPDEKYMAGADIGTLEIKDIDTQSLVAIWDGPERMWGGNWHPSGHEFSLGGTNHTEDRTGLWIYDMEKGQAEKALSGQVASASWAPDGTEITISLGAPYHEIWIAELDPNMPTIEAFGPGKTLEEHNQEMVDHYARMIEADPGDAENYRLRAKYYDYMNKKEEALADIDRYEAVLASSGGTGAQDRWMRDLLIDLLHSVPENPGPPLNSSLSKTGGSLSTDGLSLFFSSRRPGGHGGSDLWISRRDTMEDNWGDAANLGSVVNSRYTDSEPSISSDGLSLYFRSHRPDGFGSGDLWVSTRSSLSSPWSAPTNLGPKVNSPTYDSWPCISADGLRLFFESTRPGGYGHYDIWVTTREVLGNEWSSPVNLGPIVNSTDLDGHPHILPDNLTLFFQSNRPGQYGWLDLWVTTRETTDSPWSKPVNLGPAVNSRYGDAGPSLTPDGSTLVFGSNRPGGYGGWDTWQVSIGASGSSKGDSSLSSLEATGDDGREEVVPRNDQ